MIGGLNSKRPAAYPVRSAREVGLWAFSTPTIVIIQSKSGRGFDSTATSKRRSNPCHDGHHRPSTACL